MLQPAAMTLPRRALLALPALLPLSTRAQPARAQPTWPDRPVRLLVGFPAGSTPDTVTRALAAHFATAFGQPFIPDNRVGAGGNIAADAVAKATDQHTLGVTINGPLTTAQALYPTLPYDPARDLLPVSQLVRMPQFLVVHPSLPADFAGFVAHARANPGKLSYGSVGPGSAGHLAMEDLKARTGTDLLHVPYRGFPPAVLDLVAGRIEAIIISAAAILPQLQAGQVRGLACTGDARHPGAPAVPTVAELGLAGAENYAFNGLIAPPGTPLDRIARLAAEARNALLAPATQQAMERAGFEVVGSGPEDFARFLAAERERWGGLIARLGIRGD